MTIFKWFHFILGYLFVLYNRFKISILDIVLSLFLLMGQVIKITLNIGTDFSTGTAFFRDFYDKPSPFKSNYMFMICLLKFFFSKKYF